MKIRKGFVRIALQRLARLDAGWLVRQTAKYFTIKRSLRSGNGLTQTGPIVAHLFCTGQCNLRCPMCPIPVRFTGREFTTGEGMAIIDSLADLGVGGISFTGGEPLLRPDIFKFIAHTKKRKMDALLVTNGLEMGRLAKEIVAADPTSVMISVDGATPEKHDKSRGRKGAFRKLEANLKILQTEMAAQKRTIRIAASTVVSSDNYQEVDGILTWCKTHGIDRVVLCPLHDFSGPVCKIPPIPGSGGFVESLLNHPLRDRIDNSDSYLKNLDSILQGGFPPAGCCAGFTTLILGYDGQVYPCKGYFETNRPLGDFYKGKGDLKAIWHSEAFNAFRRSCGECRECYLTINREFDPLFK